MSTDKSKVSGKSVQFFIKIIIFEEHSYFQIEKKVKWNFLKQNNKKPITIIKKMNQIIKYVI